MRLRLDCEGIRELLVEAGIDFLARQVPGDSSKLSKISRLVGTTQ